MQSTVLCGKLFFSSFGGIKYGKSALFNFSLNLFSLYESIKIRNHLAEKGLSFSNISKYSEMSASVLPSCLKAAKALAVKFWSLKFK